MQATQTITVSGFTATISAPRNGQRSYTIADASGKIIKSSFPRPAGEAVRNARLALEKATGNSAARWAAAV